MEMANGDDGDDGAGNTGKPRNPNLAPPWKKGESGNPSGRPKLSGLQKLCRGVFRDSLRTLKPKKPRVLFGGETDDGIPFDDSPEAKETGGLHPIVHAAVIKEAARYSGLMTARDQASTLLAAAKARGEFASKEEWLDFVAAVAGHKRRVEPPALEAHDANDGPLGLGSDGSGERAGAPLQGGEGGGGGEGAALDGRGGGAEDRRGSGSRGDGADARLAAEDGDRDGDE